MLRVPDVKASLVEGAARLSTGERVFHVLTSPAVAAMVGVSNPEVPMPLLFEKFGTPDSSTLPLYAARHPELSLLRIMLSPHPYALRSHLCVGEETASLGVYLHSKPVVRGHEFEDTQILPECRLAITSDQSYTNFKIIDLPAGCRRVPIHAANKRVVIDEAANRIKVFDPESPLPRHPITPRAGQTRSILKHNIAQVCERDIVSLNTDNEAASMFYMIGLRRPRLGESPVCDFNTVTIMERANNSITFLPKLKLNRLQHLFLKHVLLRSMGLENIVSCFSSLYGAELAPAKTHEREYFGALLERLKRRVEDAVFCLNTIEDFPFREPIRQPPDCSKVLIEAMEKYFMMCSPKDRQSAAWLGAGVVELICDGNPLSEVLGFLAKYMPIQKECTGNLLKIYALLTV
ncbi:ORF23 [Human gammaherpesvirus 8]|uniref:ORF23 n=1 Tax=Human herpesvirus 8 TaxID=37296 RepID=D0UZN5_HHV8|nr:ORF23 [Human gammaherpesvirus 8]ANI86067.1 ORF23 [synthetic construct]AFU08290.1 ORF23 [Human gammaherpesvirus 8]AKE33059.1 ORF23 [Human gammaherpesvirus 8]ALH45317.1 ORF23 [Human gammaherpesvirus 8]